MTNQKWGSPTASAARDLDDDLTGTVAQAVSRVRSGAGSTSATRQAHLQRREEQRDVARRLALFHATHKVNRRTQGSATYANTTSGALTPTNAAACRTAMIELAGPDGDPINENP